MSQQVDDQSLCEETLGLISHACREWGFFQVVNHGLRVSDEWGFFRYVGSGYGFWSNLVGVFFFFGLIVFNLENFEAFG
jgi:hypothetical protein